MGARSAEIFGGDTAVDARLIFHRHLREGLSVTKATDATLTRMSAYLRASENGPVVILALAAAQWAAGRVDRRIKNRAIKLLQAGIDERWIGSRWEAERRVVLERLLARLNSPPPPKLPLDELDEREADMAEPGAAPNSCPLGFQGVYRDVSQEPLEE